MFPPIKFLNHFLINNREDYFHKTKINFNKDERKKRKKKKGKNYTQQFSFTTAVKDQLIDE